MTFARRRGLNIAITVTAITVLFGFQQVYGASLRNPKFLTGWILVIGCIALTLLNIRKKLPVLPLGRAAFWVQCHIYLGWFVIGAFLMHSDFRFPAGILEEVLWGVFVLVAVSGVFGAFLSREIPKRMARIAEPILFERIPLFRRQLAEEAHALTLHSIKELKSATIAKFYADRLQPFLAVPRNVLGHLLKRDTELQKINHEIGALERYLDVDGKACMLRLQEIVAAKDSLDDQYAHLSLMKLWLFVHIPATYSLLILSAVHVIAVYAYSSGAP